MGSISSKKKNNLIYITNTIVFPEAVHDSVYRALNTGLDDLFVPVKVKKKKKKNYLSSEITKATSASSYIPQINTMNSFLTLIKKIILIINRCNDYHLNADNLELNLEYIYISESDNLKCIYWPIVNNNNVYNQEEFFKKLPLYLNESLISHSTITAYNNFFSKSFVLKKYNKLDTNSFLDNIRPFSLNEFEKFIDGLIGTAKTNISPDTHLFTDVNNAKQVRNTHAAENYYNPLESSKKLSKKTKNISANNSKVKLISKTARNYTDNKRCCYIQSKKNNYRLIINKTSFKIGKSTADMDCCISDNPAISRFHARIVMQNGDFYIIDNNSTNGTFINGRRIPRQQKVRINNGDIIKLANEEFIFRC